MKVCVLDLSLRQQKTSSIVQNWQCDYYHTANKNISKTGYHLYSLSFQFMSYWSLLFIQLVFKQLKASIKGIFFQCIITLVPKGSTHTYNTDVFKNQFELLYKSPKNFYCAHFNIMNFCFSVLKRNIVLCCQC